jgi:hypothetical protein
VAPRRTTVYTQTGEDENASLVFSIHDNDKMEGTSDSIELAWYLTRSLESANASMPASSALTHLDVAAHCV